MLIPLKHHEEPGLRVCPYDTKFFRQESQKWRPAQQSRRSKDLHV
jgi:hypothetical protein